MAYLVADNETRRGAEPSDTELAALLDELQQQDFDLDSLGFDEAEYGALLDGLTPELPDPGNGGDEFEPDEAAPCRVQPGDVWLLGGVHRLICGDCTDPATVERLMQGKRAFLLVSDPPYKLTGGGCQGDYFDGGYMEKGRGFIDQSRSKLFECSEFKDWLPVVSSVMQETCECFVMTNDRNLVDLLIALRDAKWKHHNLMVWDKNIMVKHDWYMKNCEFIAYGYCGKARKPRELGRGMLLQIPVNVKEKEHVSEKPVTLMVRLIENHEGDLVLDPFLGSGTTIIAAHRTGRRCYGCEISPEYCEVILQRCEAEGLTVEKVSTTALDEGANSL
jgi:DNA modification methylase